MVLASTIHDPEARLLSEIFEVSSLRLDDESVVVAYSPQTHSGITELLEDYGYLLVEGGESVVSVYRAALGRSLQEGPGHVFYCDLDRLLHWSKTFPMELAETRKKALAYDFLMVGRTRRAFATHPPTQTLTEEVANLVASKVAGASSVMDFISVCWGLSAPLVECLLSRPEINAHGFFCGWPVATWGMAVRRGYVEVDGLEWETPDRYEAEISRLGYNAWVKSFMSSCEWERRSVILRDVVKSLLLQR